MWFFLFIHILISLLACGGNALKWDLGRKKHILNNKKPGETLNIAIIFGRSLFSHLFFSFCFSSLVTKGGKSLNERRLYRVGD